MATSVKNRVSYEEDLYAWTQEQAAQLRARRTEGLDWDHLAEEIQWMVGRDRRELESRLCVILLHLLKWQARDAVKDAVDETGFLSEKFPADCPYAPDDVLAEDHFPHESF
jgi:hypothetical protein